MNNNFITGLLATMIAALIACVIAIGINAYLEVGGNYGKNAASNFVSDFSDAETKENIEVPQVVEQTLGNVASANASNIEYQSSASEQNYFYNQLDDYAKKIYDGILQNKDNMKSGTYKIEYGKAFSDVLAGDNGQTDMNNYYQSAIEALTYDHPELFYIDPTKLFLNIQTTTRGKKVTYNVFIANKDGETYLANGFNSEDQVNECQNQIEQVKNDVLGKLSGNDYDKIKQVHDYLVDNLSYDTTLSKENIYNLYGALVSKECVCEGYSKAFKYLLDEAQINNVIVLGTGTNSKGETESHAWNYVELNGTWYAVDTTWDDPVVQGSGINISSLYKHKYFLKGASTMSKDHEPNGQFTEGGKIFTYPNLSQSDF